MSTTTTAALTFPDGCLGTLSCTCLLNWTHRVELQLYGDGYAVEITDRDVMVDTGSGRPRTPNAHDPVAVQDRAFLDAAAGRGDGVRCTYADAVETLAVTLAIAESTRTGCAVPLGRAR